MRDLLYIDRQKKQGTYSKGEIVMFQKNNKKSFSIVLTFVLLVTTIFSGKNVSATTASVEYVTHVQNIGWMSYVKDGELSGTTGKSLAVESIGIRLKNVSGSVIYRTHVRNIGWTKFSKDNEVSGTTGKSLQMEGIQIKLSGEAEQKYDIYYRVHLGDGIGWMGWAKNGILAGSTGCGLRMEAIQIKLSPKSKKLTTSQSSISKPTVSVRAHVMNDGWLKFVGGNIVAGTVGQAKRMEGMILRCEDLTGGSGVTYRAHVQNIGWQDWKTSGQIAGTTGRSLRMEAVQIKLTGKVSLLYDIYYRVHVANEGWMGWACNGEAAGTEGGGLQMEAIQVKLVRKGEVVDKGGTAYKKITADSNYSSTQITLNVPSFKQNDSRWKNTYIGNKTIGQVGCLITSLAMKYSYHTGKTTYPNEMKSKLRFSGNNLLWSSATALGYTYTGSYNCGINNAMMQNIYNKLEEGKPVIIGGRRDENSTHWVVITGYQGGSTTSFSSKDFIISDPNSLTRVDLNQFLATYPTVLRMVY